MTMPPLEQIGFGPSSHKAALRLLAKVYCDPKQVRRTEEDLTRWKCARVVCATYLHAVPYLFLMTAFGRLVSFGLVPPLPATPMTMNDHLIALVFAFVCGLAISLVFGLRGALAGGLVLGFFGSLFGGFLFGLDSRWSSAGLCLGLGGGFTAGVQDHNSRDALIGILLGCLFVSLINGILNGLDAGLCMGLSSVVGFLMGFTRLYYLPAHWLLLSSRARTSLSLHPIFWDHACPVPFPALHRLLVRYAETQRQAGRAQIERLISDYPSQRMAALRARTILVARDSARVEQLDALDSIVSALPEGERTFLTQTRAVREKVLAISRQQTFANTTHRPFFREQALQALRAEINAFYAQVAGYHEPLASEFRKAAEAWLKLADRQLAEVQVQRAHEPTPQLFRAGDPVRRDSEAFVARLDIFGTLENEIMAGTGCPGILLYGRRRLGKSTIIRNLDGFLPESVMPVVISMQDPQAFTSEAALAALLGTEIRRCYPAAGALGPEPASLLTLFQFLQACNAKLESENRRLLLCVDEFEELDRRIGSGQFSQDLPAALRESVQSHRRITWLFAGSHHFSELPHVRWSSYLVSLRTLELPPFTPPETRLLLTEPLKHSRREQARQAAALFGTHFWGEDAMRRIHEEAGGWPHLVQLLAAEAVDLCNQRGKDRVEGEILGDAIARAVVTGDSVLAELMLYHSDEYPQAWGYLAGFRNQERQSPPADDKSRLLLRRHLLVKEVEDGQWTLRVPLMNRWLRERT